MVQTLPQGRGQRVEGNRGPDTEVETKGEETVGVGPENDRGEVTGGETKIRWKGRETKS